jgi:hypothetical protein
MCVLQHLLIHTRSATNQLSQSVSTIYIYHTFEKTVLFHNITEFVNYKVALNIICFFQPKVLCRNSDPGHVILYNVEGSGTVTCPSGTEMVGCSYLDRYV